MNTAMQTTSLFAHQSIQHVLGDLQRQVLDVIKENDHVTNKEIAEILEKPINVITPRTLELRTMGYVKEWGKVYDKKTGRLAIAWGENKETLL